MAKRRRSNRLLAKQTAQRDNSVQEKNLLEYMLNGIRDDRKERWHRDNPNGANVHLFVSDEYPTAENASDLHLIEPWECEEYEPKSFNFGKVSFAFDKGSYVKAYGYFIRQNRTGQIMFLERFKGAPYCLYPEFGGQIEIDHSTLTWS